MKRISSKSIQPDPFKKAAYIATVFLLPILLLCLSYFIADSESILPKELTLRYNDFNELIVGGVKDDIALASEIQDKFSDGIGVGDDALVRQVLGQKLDPLFLLGVFAGTEAWFHLAYFFRFGFAALTMCFLLRKHVGTSRIMSMVFALAYALSAPVLTFGANSAIMNAVIILPLCLCVIDNYVRTPSLKTGAAFALVAGLLYLTGPYGVIFGLPFLICALFLLAFCMRHRATKLTVTIIAGFAPIIAGLLVSGISLFSWLLNVEPTFSLKTLISDLSFKYTFFDFLCQFTDGKVLATNADIGQLAPQICMTVFVLVMLVVFLFNKCVPIKIRLGLVIVVVLYHLSIAFVPLVKLTDPYYSGNGFSAAKLCFLVALLIFFAAISFNNLSFVSNKVLYGTAVFIIALLMISNNSSEAVAPNTFSLYFSGLAVLVVVGMLIYLNGNHSIRTEAILSGLIIVGLLINTSFVIAPSVIGNTIASGLDFGTDDVASCIEAYDIETIENNTELSVVFSSNSNSGLSYIVLPGEAVYEEQLTTPVDFVNYISQAASMAPVFVDVSGDAIYMQSMQNEGNGHYLASPLGQRSEVLISADMYSEGRLFVLSSFDCDTTFTIVHGDESISREHHEPFFIEINQSNSEVDSVRLSLTSTEQESGEFTIWTLDANALATLNAATISIDSNSFELDTSSVPPIAESKLTVLTSMPFSKSIIVSLGSSELSSYSLGGLLAFDVPYSPGTLMNISIKKDNFDAIFGSILSIAGVAGLVVLYYYGNYSKEVCVADNKDTQKKEA